MQRVAVVISKAASSSQIRFVVSSGRSTFRSDVDVGFMTATTSVGLLLVAADDERVVAIFIEEGRTANITLGKLRRRFPKSKFSDNHVRPLLSAVVQFIETPKANLLLPMEIRGTSFQQKVWREVLKIPFGQTTSFAVIAKQIGVPKAVRAVGNACSQNPLEFAIPCHRVLRSNGSWSGGSVWGDFRQSTLVAREAEANGSQ